MNYRELFPRVREMVRQKTEQELTDNLLDLPTAFEFAARRQPSNGLLLSGWDFFNQATKGLRPNEFTILCGPSGIGKTTLLANLNLLFVAQGVPTFSAPVEIGHEDYVQKIASIVSGMSVVETKAHWQSVREKFYPFFFSNPAHVLTCYDSRVSHLQLMCDLLHSYETKGTQIALIDNLNFMIDPGDGKNQNAVMDRVMHEWIVFVKKLPIHVIMVMHPRKTENGRVESEYDVKGSSTAIQEAQNVLLFNRLRHMDDAPTGLEQSDPKLCREIKIAKCRKNGRAVGSRIIFSLDAICERYTERRILE
jgi:hypothetical protein